MTNVCRNYDTLFRLSDGLGNVLSANILLLFNISMTGLCTRNDEISFTSCLLCCCCIKLSIENRRFSSSFCRFSCCVLYQVLWKCAKQCSSWCMCSEAYENDIRLIFQFSNANATNMTNFPNKTGLTALVWNLYTYCAWNKTCWVFHSRSAVILE
jgi:hypothetical protein